MSIQTYGSQVQTDWALNKPARPALWLRVSILTGITAQLTAIATGGALLAISIGLGNLSVAFRETCLLAGLILIYLNTHAIGHYIVGRAVGIKFAGFGLRGTDHPENYPPILRQIMSALPMWTAITVPASRRAASGIARAAMYAAGETSTIIFSLSASLAAFLLRAPWSTGVFIAAIAWSLGSAIAVSQIEKGDYYKAIHALRKGSDRRQRDQESRRAPV